jgi:hypothetical protein
MLRSRAGLGKAPKIETRHGDLIYVLSPCWLLPWVLQLAFYKLRGWRCDGCAFEVNLKEIWTSACWWRTRPRSDASQVHEDTWGQANLSYENWQKHYPIISYLQLEPQRRSRWVSSLQLGMLWNKQLSLMTHVTQRSRRQSCIITRVESSGHARCYTTTTWTKAAMLQFDEIAQAPKAPFGYNDSYLITNNRCSTIPTTRDRIRFMVGFSKR